MALPNPNKLPDHDARTLRDHIAAEISDLISCFLYYDRKESEAIPMLAIDRAVAAGEVTVDEIVDLFRAELTAGLSKEKP